MATLSLPRWEVRVTIPETNDGCSQSAYFDSDEVAIEIRDRAKATFLEHLKTRSDVVEGSIDLSQCRTTGGWVRMFVKYRVVGHNFVSIAEFESLYDPLETTVLSAGSDPCFELFEGQYSD
jgi:hypothetical protein